MPIRRRPVDFSSSERWLDPHLRKAPIAAAAKPGENTIEITGRSFDVRMELEAVYLLGDFGVRPVAKGFELTKSAALRFGSWAKQGRPFDGATTVYSTTVNVPKAGRLRLELGRWAGSVVETLLDGKRAAILGWPPYRTEAPVSAGSHEIGVRVVGTARNVFGPFHDPRPCCDRVPWPGHWTLFATIGQPAGADYESADYGLFEPPRLALVQ